MNAEPKLPPFRGVSRTRERAQEIHAYGLQCFEAGRQQGMAQWVSVQERMPDLGAEVLVYSKQPWEKKPSIKFDTWDEQHEAPLSFSSATIPIGPGWDQHDDFESVTHWALIEPPKA